MNPKIAITGSGLAGLSVASLLAKHPVDIEMFEKARGVGGRLATRYHPPYQFDHGAQYFTVRTKAFKTFLKPYIEQEVVQPWQTELVTIDAGNVNKNAHVTTIDQGIHEADTTLYVAQPKMNQWPKALAKGKRLHLNQCIKRIQSVDQQWYLLNQQQQSFGPYDWVVITAPAPQTAALLPADFYALQTINNIAMDSCFALMLGVKTPLNWPYPLSRIEHSPIALIVQDQSKPLRPKANSWLIHSTAEFAKNHLDSDLEMVKSALLAEFARIIKQDVVPDCLDIHRWRYAKAHQFQTEHGAFIDERLKLAVCGDWCISGRVESAFTSALHLVQYLSKHVLKSE